MQWQNNTPIPYVEWTSLSTHWRWPNLLYSWCYSELLASRDWGSWLQKRYILFTSQAIPILLHAVWALLCPQDLPTDHRRHVIISQMATRPGVFEWPHRFFTNCRKIHQTCSHLNVSAADSWRHNQPKGIRALYRSHQLLGTCSTPRSIKVWFSYHKTNTPFITTSRSSGTSLFGLSNVYRRFVPKFAQLNAPLNS